MSCQTARTWSQILAGAALVLVLPLNCFAEVSLVFWLIIALIIGLLLAAIILVLVFYRCPSCGELLPTRTCVMPRFCPGCGANLEEKESMK